MAIGKSRPEKCQYAHLQRFEKTTKKRWNYVPKKDRKNAAPVEKQKRS